MGQPLYARLGLETKPTGSAASLAIGLGTELSAANRCGFYSDITPGAEHVSIVAGGVKILSVRNDITDKSIEVFGPIYTATHIHIGDLAGGHVAAKGDIKCTAAGQFQGYTGSAWSVLGGGSGGAVVNIGTADYQTLYWDNGASAWKPTSVLKVNATYVDVTATLDSSTYADGAVAVDGGVGVTKKLNVKGNVSIGDPVLADNSSVLNMYYDTTPSAGSTSATIVFDPSVGANYIGAAATTTFQLLSVVSSDRLTFEAQYGFIKFNDGTARTLKIYTTNVGNIVTIPITGTISLTSLATADVPFLNILGTWNNGATTFTGVKCNVTDSSSNAASLLLDLQVSTVSKFKIGKTGNVTATGDLILNSATTSSIKKGVQDSYLELVSGTTTGTDASIRLHGSTHATLANKLYLDTAEASFRAANGTGTRATIGAGAITVYSGTVVDVNDATDASTYDGQTGSIQTLGGASIAKGLYVGNRINVSQPILTADTPAILVDSTWNNAGVTFTLLEANVLDSASDVNSLLLDLQVGGVSKFSVKKDGSVSFSGTMPFSGVISTTDTTDASTYDGLSGSVRTLGGVSVAKKLFIGAQLGVSQGTITTDLPALNIAGTWNNGAVTFTGSKINITNTASNSSSLLFDIQVASVTKFSIRAADSRVTADGIIDINNVTDANTYDGQSGSIQTLGGASIALSLYVGSSIFSGGDIEINKDFTGTVRCHVHNTKTADGAIAEYNLENDVTKQAYIRIYSSTTTGTLLGIDKASLVHFTGYTASNILYGNTGSDCNVYMGINTSVVSSWTSGVLASGVFNVTYTLEATNSTTASVILAGGLAVAKKLYVGTSINAATGALSDTTDSTTKDTGCLVVEGGIGVEKQVCVGTNLLVLGTTDSTTKDTGCVIVEGGIGVEKQVCVGTNLLVLGTTDSTTKDTGCVIVEGGIGVEKTLVTGGKVLVKDTTDTTSSTTGCAIFDGGLGIAKALAIGSLTASTFAYANASKILTSLINADGVLYNNGSGTFSYKAIGAAAGNVAAGDHNHSGVYEPSGAVATHAALTTGVHGLGTMSQQNANAITVTGGTLSGITSLATVGPLTIAQGTLVAASNAITITETWNNAGVSFTSIDINITNTASNAGSMIMDVDVDATSVFEITRTGLTRVRGLEAVSIMSAVGVWGYGGSYLEMAGASVEIHHSGAPGAAHESTFCSEGDDTVFTWGWDGSKGFLSVAADNYLAVLGTTDATTKDTGALIVEGGVGVEKQVCVGTNLLVLGTTDSTTKDTGCLIVEGGIGVEKQVCVGTNLLVLGTTDSTTKDTGCVIVEGGIGVEKAICVGTNLKVLGTTDSTTKDTGCLIVEGGIGVEKQVCVGTNLLVLGTTDSTTKDTGCVIVEGGIGVEKQVCVGTNCLVFGTTDATSKTTGCLITTGGAGIGKDAWLGGKLHVDDTTDATGFTGTVGSIVTLGGISSPKQIVGANLVHVAKGRVIEEVLTLLASASLKLFLLFDEDGATTTIVDRSGNSHDGTLGGNASTMTPQTVGLARTLLGVGTAATIWSVADHADFSFGDGAGNDSAFSLIWCGVPTDNTSQYFIAKFADSINEREYLLQTDASDKLITRVFKPTGSSYNGRTYDTALTSDEGSVHSYMATFSGGSPQAALGIKLYRDGAELTCIDASVGTYAGMTAGTGIVTNSKNGASVYGKHRYGAVIICASALSATLVQRLSQILRSYMGVDI